MADNLVLVAVFCVYNDKAKKILQIIFFIFKEIKMGCSQCVYCSSVSSVLDFEQETYYCHVIPERVEECPPQFHCIEFESEDFTEG